MFKKRTPLTFAPTQAAQAMPAAPGPSNKLLWGSVVGAVGLTAAFVSNIGPMADAAANLVVPQERGPVHLQHAEMEPLMQAYRAQPEM